MRGGTDPQSLVVRNALGQAHDAGSAVYSSPTPQRRAHPRRLTPVLADGELTGLSAVVARARGRAEVAASFHQREKCRLQAYGYSEPTRYGVKIGYFDVNIVMSRLITETTATNENPTSITRQGFPWQTTQCLPGGCPPQA